MIGKLKATAIHTHIEHERLMLTFELPVSLAWEAQRCVAEGNALIRDGKHLAVEIAGWRDKRSQDANSYAWVLLNKLGGVLGLPPVEIYRQLIREVPNNNVIVPVANDEVERWRRNWGKNGLGWQTEIWGDSKHKGYTNVICFYGSSTYDTTQMSCFIDLIVQECQQQGIETLSPEKLAAMVGEWGE